VSLREEMSRGLGHEAMDIQDPAWVAPTGGRLAGREDERVQVGAMAVEERRARAGVRLTWDYLRTIKSTVVGSRTAGVSCSQWSDPNQFDEQPLDGRLSRNRKLSQPWRNVRG